MDPVFLVLLMLFFQDPPFLLRPHQNLALHGIILQTHLTVSSHQHIYPMPLITLSDIAQRAGSAPAERSGDRVSLRWCMMCHHSTVAARCKCSSQVHSHSSTRESSLSLYFSTSTSVMRAILFSVE